jgi:hypothetical protein
MGEGVGLTGGRESGTCMKLTIGCLRLPVGSVLRSAFGNELKCHLLPSNWHGLRNRLKCHLLQSIILSLSLIAVNVIDYHFHLLQ